MNITGLNHAVLWVRDAQRSAAFYRDVLGFEDVPGDGGDQAVFLRAKASANHHDLGLFSVGDRPAPPPRTPGLYHLAWQVASIEDLAAAAAVLRAHGALVGSTDHGVSKSLYAKDLDGIELEVVWIVPEDRWPELDGHSGRERLDLDAEVARWGGLATG